jgi:hypothetical protein
VKFPAYLLAALPLAFAVSQAQPTKASMEALTMPRPSFNVTKTLAYPGDYGYYQLGSDRPLDHMTTNLGDPKNWFWVRYVNSGNAREVWAWVSLYPNPQGVCSHSHISYGLWAKFKYTVNGTTVTAWQRIGMGTQSGDIVNGSCKWDVVNSFQQFAGADFGWGTNYATANIRNVAAAFKYTEFVLGGITVSHGAGSCGTFQCGHPAYMVLFTLP